MIEHWDFVPKAGWGPLRFGMSRAQAATAAPELGPIDNADLVDDTVVEYRADRIPTLHYRDDRLITIDAGKYCTGLFIGSIEVHRAEPLIVLKTLLQTDPTPRELLGGLYFPQLELNVEGLYDFEAGRPFTMAEVRADDYRTFGALAPREYDALRDEMTLPALNLG